MNTKEIINILYIVILLIIIGILIANIKRNIKINKLYNENKNLLIINSLSYIINALIYIIVTVFSEILIPKIYLLYVIGFILLIFMFIYVHTEEKIQQINHN